MLLHIHTHNTHTHTYPKYTPHTHNTCTPTTHTHTQHTHTPQIHTTHTQHMHTHTHTHTHTYTPKHTPTHTYTHSHILTDFINNQTPPEFTISENQAILVPFGILSTTDRDIGNNTDVFYYNIGRHPQDVFNDYIIGMNIPTSIANTLSAILVHLLVRSM